MVHSSNPIARRLGYATYISRKGGSPSDVAEIPSWALFQLPKFASFGQTICRVPEHDATASTCVDLELMNVHQNPNSLALQGYRLGIVKKGGLLYLSTKWDKNNELWLRIDEANDGAE